MWDEERVQVVAGQHRGLLSRGEMADLGVTNREIDRRIGQGRVVAVHPGVYYVDSVPMTWKTMVMAAVMAAGADAVASHRSAAVLWGLDAIHGAVIEVTVPYVESPEPNRVIVHRSRRSGTAAQVESIPVTTPERTLFDLAPMVPTRVLEKAARSAVHMGLTTVDGLDMEVARFGGRGVSGTRRMRWLVRALADDKSGSVAEIDLKNVLLDAPMPRPVQQLRIGLPGGGNAYPDFSWPDLMRIVEVDGFDSHGTPKQLQDDLRRQNDLMGLGWHIRRFTATEVRQEPDRVRAEIVRFVNSPGFVKDERP
jgi:hypothetical protein